MKNYKFAVISNVVFEPYFRKSSAAIFEKSDITSQFLYVPYEGYMENSDKLKDCDGIVVCLNFDNMYPNILNDFCLENISLDDVVSDVKLKCGALYETIRNYSFAPIIWFGFEDYCYNVDALHGAVSVLNGLTDKLNEELRALLNEDVFIDFKRLIAGVGIQNSYDIKGKYRWNAPYSKALIEMMAAEVYKQYCIHKGISKKCIVVDCDNVLWGGILSEDGIEGIQIEGSGFGRPFQDFQRFLLSMYCHGVILTVCSKNDEADVLRVFREHSGMILKEEHISCFKCNWDNKPKNIRDISSSLNIGLDSMVFIDDSVFEIEAVKSVLPEVVTVIYDRNTVYNDLSCFNLKVNSDIDNINKRTETYRTNSKRDELKNRLSFEDYLVSLDTRIDIHKTLSDELARVSELSQRTNKCTNGVRYTVAELKEKIECYDYEIYTVSMRDKFSDLGIVGAIGLYNKRLKLFSLSCRALGRGVEEEMIIFAKQHGATEVDFFSTGKNGSFMEKWNK